MHNNKHPNENVYNMYI